MSNINFGRSQGPDAYALQYAQKKGISLEEAKAELRSQFGDPVQGAGGQSNLFPGVDVSHVASSNGVNLGGSVNNSSNIPLEAYSLVVLGIPLEVILQGDNAIMNFAQENNIQLPARSGQKLNFSA